MASLDFVYDILEKLNEEKVDYLVVTVQHTDKESRSDIFYNMSAGKTPNVIAETLNSFELDVLRKYLEDQEEDLDSEEEF
tara:strand:- start:1017 stop:1256 length:240 start_codon:yes stop_codon:yes gene_type:complete